MNQRDLETTISEYLIYCDEQKRLDEKTRKAYRIDLTQFCRQTGGGDPSQITSAMIEAYVASLHQTFQPKTVKRKIASVKAFFHYLEYRDIIDINPFHKIQLRFREPLILPKTIPLPTMEHFLAEIYHAYDIADNARQKRSILRDIAVSELLFATGIRISELCSLRPADINLFDQSILIYGKGDKERRLQLGTSAVLNVLARYSDEFQDEIRSCDHFFVNQCGRPLSDQSVRRMINKYTSRAAIDQHITPHMFRHTFATSLLEADVDIRYIQEMLGHSSINITQIYTHVALSKQRDILTTKHPRKDFRL